MPIRYLDENQNTKKRIRYLDEEPNVKHGLNNTPVTSDYSESYPEGTRLLDAINTPYFKGEIDKGIRTVKGVVMPIVEGVKSAIKEPRHALEGAAQSVEDFIYAPQRMIANKISRSTGTPYSSVQTQKALSSNDTMPKNETQAKAQRAGEEIGKAGIGIGIASTVPGINAKGLSMLSKIGKVSGAAALAEVPYALKSIEKGNPREALKGVGVGVGFDLLTLGGGKLLKLAKRTPNITDDIAGKLVRNIQDNIDPQLKSINIGGIPKEIEKVTKDDIITLTQAMQYKLGKSISPEDLQKATGEVVETLKDEFILLRKDISTLGLDEQKKFLSGKSPELLREGQYKVDTPIMPEKSGLGGVGRGLDKKHLNALSQPKKETTQDFEKFLASAQRHRIDRKAISPFEMTGKTLENSLKDIDTISKKLAAKKRTVLDANAGKTVSLVDVKNKWNENLKKILNIEIEKTDDGFRLIPLEGRRIPDPNAIESIELISDELVNLPDKIEVRLADDVKRRIQKLAYNNMTGKTNPSAKKLSREIAGLLDSKLDNVLGDEYKIANDKLRDIINLTGLIERSLGQTINFESGLHKHSASMMKRAQQSVTDSGIKDIFRQIEKTTGGKYDLFQSAAYAEMAMKAMGDTPAFSLLEAVQMPRGVAGPSGLLGIADKVTKMAPKTIGTVTSMGKDTPEYLLDYYKKAQRKAPVKLEKIAKIRKKR